jgi:hypothetical protein
MGNRRSGTSSTSSFMANPHSGPSSASASGSAARKPATKKRASTDNQEYPGISPEQWALYKSIRTQLEAKKKAANSAEDEGMSSILFLHIALVHNYFVSYPNEEPTSTR